MNILEINQKNLSLLDVSQLTAFLNIFKGVSNPKAKKIVKDLARELSTRKTEGVEEASIKDIIKSVKASSKKIGGIINKVMDDAEFQKAYAKYIDNPNDKNRLKKIQDYTNGMIGDMFESSRLKEERLKKVCSLVLGEDFDQDFIYEDIDFTKPSVIKDAYKSFALKEADGCWDGYKKVGMKKKENKMVPNCVPEENIEEATELYKKGKITLTKFAMGRGKGAGLQINYGMKFIQIPEKDIKQLAQGITYVTKSVSQFKEEVELEEAVKFWTVTITKKAGKLFKGQTVDVKASNSAEAIKKGIKQMKGNPALVPGGSVDAVLGESIEESNKDKYMWGDINKAMSSAGLNPRAIMNVLSKLKGKAIK